jgi:hypothetical protein
MSTITITGSGVSEWRDKSGFGITLSQTTDVERPIINSTFFSGKQCIQCVNSGTVSGDFLSGANPIPSSGEMTVINAIFTPASASDNFPWNWTFALDSPARICLGGPWQTTTRWYLDINGFAGSNRLFGNFGGHQQRCIISSRHSVSQNLMNMHGNGSPAFASAGAGTSATASTYRLGKGPDNSYGGVSTAEILVFNRYLRDQERMLVEGYLSHKWNIPLAATNPFANRPPLIGD